MATVIEMNFCRQDFEEIYFENKQGNYISSPTTRIAFYILLTTTLMLSLPIAYSISNYAEPYIFITGIGFVLALGNYLIHFRTLYKWKSQLSEFLDVQEQYEKHTLILSDDFLSMVQDDNELIENWKNFTLVQIQKEYIFIEGKERILLPRKSMSDEAFLQARSIISEKCKQSIGPEVTEKEKHYLK